MDVDEEQKNQIVEFLLNKTNICDYLMVDEEETQNENLPQNNIMDID